MFNLPGKHHWLIFSVESRFLGHYTIYHLTVTASHPHRTVTLTAAQSGLERSPEPTHFFMRKRLMVFCFRITWTIFRFR